MCVCVIFKLSALLAYVAVTLIRQFNQMFHYLSLYQSSKFCKIGKRKNNL